MDNYQLISDTWNKVVDQYEEKFMDSHLYDDTYDAFCAQLKDPQARILEIGCGPGNITRYLLNKMPGLKIEAIDIAPTMIERAKQHNPSASFKVMDCREIASLPTTYDAIMCGFCLPYLYKEDARKLISDCAGLLKSGGVFYFSAIEAEHSLSGIVSSSNGEHKMYMNYHEEGYITEWLKENDLDLISLQRKELTDAAEASSTHMIFIVKKK